MRNEKNSKGPRDPDAKWGRKRKQKSKSQPGNKGKQAKYFLGYKGHFSMNSDNNPITSLEVTSREVYDGHYFCPLVEKDLLHNIHVETYAANRGYDDGNNHSYLQEQNLNSAICLKRTRIKKKDPNKQVWLEIIQTPAYKEGRKERYKIERKFGEAKQGHGLG